PTPAERRLLLGLQLVGFSLLMIVVLAAGIPIEDCGCFGTIGLPETPLQVLIRDLIMLALLGPVWQRQDNVLAFDA
ncbi:MAG: MauE/DoxX family redox-associated membrane protein, partial [Candidatus Tectomicrobia bacterium]